MRFSESEIVEDMLEHIRQAGGEFREWRVGTATNAVVSRVAHLAVQRLCGFSCHRATVGGIIRGHVTAAAVGFVRSVLLFELPGTSESDPPERTRVWDSRAGDKGTPRGAWIPADGMGVCARSLARHHLPEDWKWSSVHDYTATRQAPAGAGSPIPVDRINLPADPRTRI